MLVTRCIFYKHARFWLSDASDRHICAIRHALFTIAESSTQSAARDEKMRERCHLRVCAREKRITARTAPPPLEAIALLVGKGHDTQTVA
jgi:hypothetical protein